MLSKVLVGIHVAHEFRVQVARMIRRLQRQSEIVHREHVFQQLRFLEVANAAGLPRRIELMRQRIGARVEVVVVARLVDAHAPQHDRGMVPVAADHAAHIVDGDVLPRLVADVLPAGNLFEHQQSDFVAAIEKVPRLRIVRGAHDVAAEVRAQNVRIAPLHAARHRLADIGKGLVAIESAQLHDLAVEREAVVGERGFAKADAPRLLIHHLAAAHQPHTDVIQLRAIQIPQLDLVELRNLYCVLAVRHAPGSQQESPSSPLPNTRSPSSTSAVSE